MFNTIRAGQIFRTGIRDEQPYFYVILLI